MWAGHEGEAMAVRVLAKCAGEQVSLTLNGEAVADSPAEGAISQRTEFMASFTVPYAAGTLTASCGGEEGPAAAPSSNATRSFTTAKAVAKLVVTADRDSISAYRGDLSYVTVTVVDAEGTPLPEAQVPISFAVTGDGELAAVGSGDPTDVSSFHCPGRPGRLSALSAFLIKSVSYGAFVWARRALNNQKRRFSARAVPARTTWQGRAVAILRPTTTTAGAIKLTATAAGLPTSSITVATTPASSGVVV